MSRPSEHHVIAEAEQLLGAALAAVQSAKTNPLIDQVLPLWLALCHCRLAERVLETALMTAERVVENDLHDRLLAGYDGPDR